MSVRPHDPTTPQLRRTLLVRLAGAIAVAATVVLVSAVPALAQADTEDKSLFEGFGISELLVLAVVVLATVVALIALAWLLVLLTGADRDYLELPPEAPGEAVPGPRRAAPAAVATPRATPASVMRAVQPSTWLALGVVALLAAVTVVWLGLGGDDGGDDDATPEATTTTALDCSRVPFLASRLPAGFSGGLRSGTGTQDAAPADRCVWHWSSTAGVIQLLGQSAPASGTTGQVDIDGKRMWVQGTLDGSTQVVFEEREFGGAAGAWFTLLSRSVERDALVDLAAGLQRCQGNACNTTT